MPSLITFAVLEVGGGSLPLFLWLLESRVLPSRAELSSNKQIWLQEKLGDSPQVCPALLCLGRERKEGVEESRDRVWCQGVD